jgi:hypothetical protein
MQFIISTPPDQTVGVEYEERGREERRGERGVKKVSREEWERGGGEEGGVV